MRLNLHPFLQWNTRSIAFFTTKRYNFWTLRHPNVTDVARFQNTTDAPSPYTAMIRSQPDPILADLVTQNAVPFFQLINDVLLLVVHPTGETASKKKVCSHMGDHITADPFNARLSTYDRAPSHIWNCESFGRENDA